MEENHESTPPILEDPSLFIPTKKDCQRKQTEDYEIIPGDKIRQKKHSHSRGSKEWSKGDKFFLKGIATKKKDERINLLEDIETGLEMYFDEDSPIFEQWNDWDEETELSENQSTPPPSFNPSTVLKEILAKRQTGEDIHAELKDYKKRLTEQQLAVATLINTISAIVYKDPDIDIDILKRIMTNEKEGMLLTPEQHNLFDTALAEYSKKHAIVETYNTSYENKSLVFFERVFGVPAQGPIEVIKGPMTVTFRCFTDDDYVQAYNFKKIQNNESISNNDIDLALMSGAAAFGKVRIKDLNGIVVIERVSPNQSHDWTKEVRKHEEQHQINKLFTPIERNLSGEDILTRAFLQEGTDDEKADRLMKDYCRFQRIRLGIDSRARDEILAYFRGGTAPSTIYDILTTSPLYDYKSQHEQLFENLDAYLILQLKIWKNNLKITNAGTPLPEYIFTSITQEKLDKTISQVFVNEYNQNLRTWIGVLYQLKSKGYTDEEIQALLYSCPASSWPNLVRRLPETL